MSATAITQGVHHVGLTVLDLRETARFFVDALGFSQVGQKPDYPAVFVSDGSTMITLWQVADPAAAVAFDRKTVIGLHHLALKVADARALDEAHAKLRATDGVDVEFAPQSLGGGPTRHMMCRIPSGIRLELIAPVA